MPERQTWKLDSWKSIAYFLGRDVSTARRWERQCGLPVHRVPGSKAHSVYAYPEELDAWLRGQIRPSPGAPGLSTNWAEVAGADGRDRLGPGATEEPARGAGSERPRARIRALTLAAVALTAVVTVILGLNLGGWRDRLLRKAAQGSIRSLAVLPLQSLSGDPAQDYLADGMTEELITDLAQIRALHVISRSSVMQYKGTRKPLPQIGRELNVDAVVEGAVMRSGDRVRITVQLVYAPADRHLWAKSYERNLRDILALQSDVARAISNEIRIKLTAQEQARLASARPVGTESYQAYLEGRYFWNKRTGEGLVKAIEYFSQAIEKDPNYALAYTGLADSYALLGLYHQPSAEVAPKAKAAAVKALELEDTLAEAHTSLAAVKAFYDWDWPGSEREFQRALELNPGYAPARHWYATVYLAPLRRYKEAIAEMKRAQELEPVSLIINTDLGWTYFVARRYDEALKQYKKTLDMDPNFVPVHFRLWQYYAQLGMYQEALEEYQINEGLPGREEFAGSPGRTYSGLDYRNSLQEKLRLLKEQRTHVSSYAIAMLSVLLGEKDQALALLRKAYEERDPGMIYLKAEPVFDSLRSDPRFHDLVRRIGLEGTGRRN